MSLITPITPEWLMRLRATADAIHYTPRQWSMPEPVMSADEVAAFRRVIVKPIKPPFKGITPDGIPIE